MKHLFTLKSLMLTLVMLFGLNAWGETATLTFTKACGGSGTDDKGNTWTVTSDAAESNYDGTKGIHYGTNSKAVSYLQLTSSIDGIIKSVKVKATGASGRAKLNVTVGGSAFGSESSITSTAKDYEFTGEATGDIVVKLSQTSTKKALYVKSIVVTYEVVAAAVEKPVITASAADLNGNYFTTSTATAKITCETEGATIKYAITDGAEPAVDEWKVYSAEVEIFSAEPAKKTLWAKAEKDADKSAVVSKEFTFIKEPTFVKFTKVTDASQLVAGAKYAIINATTTKIVSGYDSNTYTSTTTSASDGIVTAMDNAVIVFTLGGNGDADDSWTLYDNTKGQYVGSNSETKFSFAADASTLSNWTITFVDTEGSVKIYNKTKTRGFNFMTSSGAVKNYAISNYGGDDYTYPTLWQMVEETEEGLDAVLDGNVGGKYQINCALRVNFKDANYAYASTTENNSSKKNTANEGDKGKGWSDKEADFTQNDWVAIEGSGLELGAEIEAGSVAKLVSNGAFPVIEFVSMSEPASGTPFEANTFRVANFNIGKDVNAVKYVWLVAPQAGEYCHVRGYVEAAADGKVTLKSAKESSTATVDENVITVDPVEMTVNYTGEVTTGNWFSFTGIVVNGTNGLELNAISAEDVSTGVEGVEASSVKVYGAEGVINVVSEEVAPIAVYSANGAIVSSVEASSASIAVAPGFYIVKAGNSVSKVTVK